jgi:assimilatory nitrate reductase catalytic subunit
VRALGGRDRGDLLFLPSVAIPPVEDSREFPLRLNTYRLMSRPTGGGANQPWLLEQPAVHVRASWEGWVEIHPTTAAGLALNDGDTVWIESAKGRIRSKVKLYAGTVPEVIHIPLFGGEGPNPNDLITVEPDPFRGFGLLNTTRVRVRKA